MLTASIAAGARTVEIKLLQTSDVHGNYFPRDFITRKESKGSLSRVASVVDRERNRYGENLIVVDNGDILQGQPTAYYYNYIDTVSPHVAAEALNFIGYDVLNVGNHDVETGRKNLERWASQCSAPVLGANIIDTAKGEPAFPPYALLERGGVKIAILGMITPAIPAWLPEQLWEGLEFEDMETTARKWLPIIRERENPDIVVGLFHSGQAGNILSGYKENASMEIARNVPGFDAVLMGHDHRVESTKVVNTAGDSVVVMDPANGAKRMAEVIFTLELDDDGKVVSKRADGHLLDISSEEVSERYREHFKEQRAAIDKYVSEPIGILAKPITTRDAFFGPSKFVDLIHALQLSITGADISFSAPLSFDITIDEGQLYVSDMFNLYKYENMLYVMELTGAEILGYLEESYGLWANTMTSADDHLLLFKETPTEGDPSRSTLANPTYNFDSAAGIIYTVDVTQPKGSRVNIISMADGTPFDPQTTYRVALNSYRGNGGGELLTKGAGIPRTKLRERVIGATDRDLRHYFTEHIRHTGLLDPQPLNQWKFIPEEWTGPAAERDREILYPDDND